MKRIPTLTLCLFLIVQLNSQAQNWVNNGNTLTGNGTIGTNSNHSLLFETYNTERGRITNTGLWGIGTATPNAKLHINSATGQDPLRITINGASKLLVHRYGGLSVGSGNTPPANGLYVAGSVGIGTATPGSSYQLRVVNSATYGIGIHAYGNQTGIIANGIHGGITAYSDKGAGVLGSSINSDGGSFFSQYGYGLFASTYYGSWAGYFSGNVYSTGTYHGSDKNLKKDIQEVGNAMSIINKLKPYNYEFRDDGKYAYLHMPKGRHYGLLAQDVEEVLPNLVKESAHEIIDHKSLAAIQPSADGKHALPTIKNEPKESINIKAVNYTELIPIVIKGMQEQQQTIQQLQEENNALKDRLAKIEAALVSGKNGSTGGIIGASMQQNQPNPFNVSTTINYNIPKGSSGKILVYDATGKLIKNLTASDEGQMQMNAYGLSAGTYTYSLMVDGKIVDSKRMVIEK